MFLRSQIRKKDGRQHTCWSVVENKRLHDGRVAQRQVLYLGEVNDSQRTAWRKTLDAHTAGSDTTSQIALFPHDRPAPADDERIVRIRLDELSRQRPRQWGGCWLALELYRQLGLDSFFAEQLPASRKGTRWDQILQVLVTQRLLAPVADQGVSAATFCFHINRARLREGRRREGDICCAATSPGGRPPSCGRSTCNWCKWKKPSRT